MLPHAFFYTSFKYCWSPDCSFILKFWMIQLLLLNALRQKTERKCEEPQVSLKVLRDNKSGPTKFISNTVSHNNHQCQLAFTVCCETALIVALPGCHLKCQPCVCLMCLAVCDCSRLPFYEPTVKQLIVWCPNFVL